MTASKSVPVSHAVAFFNAATMFHINDLQQGLTITGAQVRFPNHSYLNYFEYVRNSDDKNNKAKIITSDNESAGMIDNFVSGSAQSLGQILNNDKSLTIDTMSGAYLGIPMLFKSALTNLPCIPDVFLEYNQDKKDNVKTQFANHMTGVIPQKKGGNNQSFDQNQSQGIDNSGRLLDEGNEAVVRILFELSKNAAAHMITTTSTVKYNGTSFKTSLLQLMKHRFCMPNDDIYLSLIATRVAIEEKKVEEKRKPAKKTNQAGTLQQPSNATRNNQAREYLSDDEGPTQGRTGQYPQSHSLGYDAYNNGQVNNQQFSGDVNYDAPRISNNRRNRNTAEIADPAMGF